MPKMGGDKRKSRYGCRNCKLRKVKCDQQHPNCLRCRQYGIQCNFQFGVSDLQPVVERRAQQQKLKISELQTLQPPISNLIWCSDGSTCFTLDWQDRQLFNRFRHRTLYALGGFTMLSIYEDHLFEACFRSPFLMHGILAVAAIHERYLGLTQNNRQQFREAYHWSKCTVSFNKRLGKPIEEEESKDCLWATAGMLSILTFASHKYRNPEEAWPLCAEESSDLTWLHLAAGKLSLWNLVNPLRPESVFRVMTETFIQSQRSMPTKGIDGLPEDLVQACRLEESSTPENNPYFAVAHSLVWLLRVPRDQGQATREAAFVVTSCMHGRFSTLLEEKDPVALLLFGLWYTRARKWQWWVNCRAQHELPAICIYLQRYHADDKAVQSLIPWGEIANPGMGKKIEAR